MPSGHAPRDQVIEDGEDHRAQEGRKDTHPFEREVKGEAYVSSRQRRADDGQNGSYDQPTRPACGQTLCNAVYCQRQDQDD